MFTNVLIQTCKHYFVSIKLGKWAFWKYLSNLSIDAIQCIKINSLFF